MKLRETLLRQEFLDLEEEIKQLQREIKRGKPTVWQKIRTGMKRMWLKLFSKCPKHKRINQTMDHSIEPDVNVFQIKSKAPTMALDTPSKKILMPSPSFIDNLENSSVLTMTMSETMSETLTPGSPFDFHGSYLGSVKRIQPQQRVTVAPSSSWVRGVLSSSSTSLAAPLMTSTSASGIAIPFFGSDDDLTPTNSYSSTCSEDDLFFTPLHR